MPKVTIDFGDGRKLERTLTGNSIHYILDADGRVIDALPGLYGPKPFLREIERAEKIVQQAATLPPAEQERLLMAYHRERAAAIQAAWQDDLNKLGVQLAYAQPNPASHIPQKAPNPPAAAAAGRVAMTKWVVEMPMVAAVNPGTTLEQATTDAVWNRIAMLHAGKRHARCRQRRPDRQPTSDRDRSGRIRDFEIFCRKPAGRMVRAFQGSIALDTVRNEYLFHRQIHQWLAAGSTTNLDKLNERVYSELFLTPSSDPWLGLMPADTYTALENNGVVK